MSDDYVGGTMPQPVIVVPAITASVLVDRHPMHPEVIWDPTPLGRKDYARTTPNPLNPAVELQQPTLSDRERLADIAYDEMVTRLRNRWVDDVNVPAFVFPFAYDWRKPLEDLGDELIAFTESVVERCYCSGYYSRRSRSAIQPNFIGHSMGGLVIAAALLRARISGGRTTLPFNKAVTYGTPFQGSLDAIEQMTIGDGERLPRRGPDGRLIRGGRGPNPQKRLGARLTPALYYLLPSFAGAVNDENGRPVDLTDPINWQPSILETILHAAMAPPIGYSGKPGGEEINFARNFLRNWATRGQFFRDAINDPNFLTDRGVDRANWLQIAGVGDDTRIRCVVRRDAGGAFFDLSDGLVGDKDWYLDTPGQVASLETGDGTVPLASALWPAIGPERVICLALEDYALLGEAVDRLAAYIDVLHTLLPTSDFAQKLAVNFLKSKQRRYDLTFGRPPPHVDLAAWTASTGLKPRQG